MSDMTRRGCFGATFAGTAIPALAGESAQSRRAAPPPIAVDKDVVFGNGGDLDLKLDIYRPPPGKEKRMATIHFHGGGFRGGSKESLAERIQPFAALG